MGVQLSYDIGAVPAAAAQASSAAADREKARVDAKKQADDIILDVRSTALSLARARHDLELTRNSVGEAEAALRSQHDRQGQGLARRLDVVNAELALARARFALSSREIDVQISAADFARAVGLDLQ